jgi:hypothetical protein
VGGVHVSFVHRGLRDARRIVCAGWRSEACGIFPISSVQVDTATVATDPNIAGSCDQRLALVPTLLAMDRIWQWAWESHELKGKSAAVQVFALGPTQPPVA